MEKKKYLPYEAKYSGYFDDPCYRCKKIVSRYVSYGKNLSPEQLSEHFQYAPSICDECNNNDILEREEYIYKVQANKECNKLYNEIKKSVSKKWYNELRNGNVCKEERLTKKNINRLRGRISFHIKNNIPSKYIENIIGCNIQDARNHLEIQFNENMSWGTHGAIDPLDIAWNIDHIIPCAAYSFNNINDIYICFNYRNYQPMLARLNISKGDKFSEDAKKAYDNMIKMILFPINDEKEGGNR